MSTNPAVATTFFYTWNTQGNFTTDPKATTINSFLTDVGGGATPCIVFVQEGGVDKAGIYTNWCAVGGAAVGAKNERCTNYILVNKAWQDLPDAAWMRLPLPTQTATLINPTVLIGGGEAGRMPAAIAMGRLLLVSWPSLAGESNEDSAAVFGAFQFNPWYQDKFDRIIVGGDFNTSPDSITTMLNQKSDKPKPYWAWVVSSGMITHPNSGREIDFFVVLDRSQVLDMTATMIQTIPSDHNAVRTQI
jgi:hypothetical protein